MMINAEQVYNEAIQLNPIERAELIEKLFASFSSNINTENELKWKEEVKSRASAYKNEEIQSDSMENVFKRLSKR